VKLLLLAWGDALRGRLDAFALTGAELPKQIRRCAPEATRSLVLVAVCLLAVAALAEGYFAPRMLTLLR
jgi:hypothetical protein